MSGPPHVLTIGAANLDVVAEAPVLLPGTSNPGTVRVGPGGAARNVAENLPRLGARVRLACAASGPLAPLVLEPTERAGVAVHPLRTRDGVDVHVAPAL